MPKNLRHDITRLTPQVRGSNSLRSTVPKEVVQKLRLNDDDFIHWVVVDNGKTKYAKVQQWKMCKS